MRKIIFTLLLFFQFTITFAPFASGQISVYFSEKEEVVGWEIGTENFKFQRDRAAEEDCRAKGGHAPYLVYSTTGGDQGYGCYALVYGLNNEGKRVVGGAGGYDTRENAVIHAKNEAMSKGATEKSLYTVTSGCLQRPQEPEKDEASKNNSKPAQWSNWERVPNCSKLEYRFKTTEKYNLTLQVTMFFEVKSTFQEPVNFVFDLLNKSGKKEFGDPHTVAANGIIPFDHKMTSDYIKSIRVGNIKYSDGKPADCDGAGKRESDKESIKALMAKYSSLCTKLSESRDKALSDQHSRICTLGPAEEANAKTEATLKTKIKQMEDLFAKYVSDDKEKSLDDLIAEHKSLCEQLKQTDDNAHNVAYNTYCSNDIQLTGTFENQINQVKNKITILKNALASADAKTTEKETEAARLKKEAEEKAEKFNQYMAEGRTALGNEEFDNAISKYNTAKSYATNAQQTNEANNAIAEARKAKEDAARKKRIEAQKKRDQEEDAAYASSVAGTSTLMLLITDHYPAKGAYCRIQAGLGIENIPLMINIPKNSNSETTTNLLPTIHLGLKFGFFNKKPISWHLNPMFSFGINALTEGTSGTNIDYGGTSYITLSPKAKSKIKLFAEAGYIGRTGDYTYDLDAASGGTSATDRIEKGSYNYHFIRTGGGIMFHLIHGRKETYIKPGLFFDKMSFAQKGNKPSMLFNVQLNIESVIILEFNYSKNYAIPGKADYPIYVIPENQNYWNFKIIRQGAF